MKIKNKEEGFTLIELLVVIAIIGILSSVVLASMNSARKKARDARRQADMKSLQLALESYYDTNSFYPKQSTEVDVSSSTLGDLTSEGYITVIPSDPSTDQSYRYISTAAGTEYCIGANVEGTPPTPADTCPSSTKTTGTGIDYMVGQ